mgnify:FL=1
MKVFAISDLHLASAVNKPMDVFGAGWENYVEKITQDWQSKVSGQDLVLLPGDFSWAMTEQEVQPDLQFLQELPGTKVLLRGNHDYWWSTLSKVRRMLPSSVQVLQNDCLRFGSLLVCGSRGWTCPDKALSKEDEKIYKREALRLELSLQEMQRRKQEGDRVICMMHFPPFNVRREDSAYTQLLIRYGVQNVIFGHLHGKDCRADLDFYRFGIHFRLVSTDLVGHRLTELTELSSEGDASKTGQDVR